jgi:hypothetical protein
VVEVGEHTQPWKKLVHVGTVTNPENAPLQLFRSQLCGGPQVPGVAAHWHPKKFSEQKALPLDKSNMPPQPFRPQL